MARAASSTSLHLSSLLWVTGLVAVAGAGCSSDDPNTEADAVETGDGDGDATTNPGTETSGDGDGDGDGEPVPEHFEVGFDVVDLSPTDTELGLNFYLGGYGVLTERGSALGVHDPIYVRSMAIGYGDDEGGVFAIVDTVGMGNLWTRQIRSEVAAATGLSPEQVVIGSTHTHAGPDLQGLWGGVPDAYRERILAEIVDSMTAAWEQRIPATLEVASTTADNRNRRGWDMTDDVMFVLQARALADPGQVLGAMVAFAAHPVVLGSNNRLVSRDFCGYAVDGIEAELDAPVLLFNGVQGDVSPRVPDGDYADDFERAAAYGGHLAGQANAALAALEPVAVDFARGYGELTLDVSNQNFIFAAQAGILDYEFTTRGDVTVVDTQTAYFRFGDEVQLIAFPGESLTRNGLAVREGMSAPHSAILGLSGDALGYFIPSDEWMTGLNSNYEESVSVGPAAGDRTRDLMLELIAADR
jgi:hypothetical protein